MLKKFLSTIPNDITVVAASKYGLSEQLKFLYENGIRNFGENRVDSFLEKKSKLNDLDISWHFIGHLQKNKAKLVVNEIEYLHSLDSLDLAKLIQKYRTTPLKCFVEVSINNEETKNGVKVEETEQFIKNLLNFDKIEVIGLMMMAEANSNHDSLINQFRQLKTLRDNLENNLKIKIPNLSMGMSDDYLEAIECGATHIRLGRILFKFIY
jgi:pyridoxal phosphate enzyme (YggS family)